MIKLNKPPVVIASLDTVAAIRRCNPNPGRDATTKDDEHFLFVVALIKIIPEMRGPEAELCEFVSKTSYKLAQAMMTERECQRR